MSSPPQRKLCLVGAPSVGKTSLVRRFVEGTFPSSPLTSIGVRVDRTTLHIDDSPVDLVIWDMAGDDTAMPLRTSYFHGAHGILFVADGTRAMTLERIDTLRADLRERFGRLPCVLAVNKTDLADEWEVESDRIRALREESLGSFTTSARTGENVDEAFRALARAIA